MASHSFALGPCLMSIFSCFIVFLNSIYIAVQFDNFLSEELLKIPIFNHQVAVGISTYM